MDINGLKQLAKAESEMRSIKERIFDETSEKKKIQEQICLEKIREYFLEYRDIVSVSGTISFFINYDFVFGEKKDSYSSLGEVKMEYKGDHFVVRLGYIYTTLDAQSKTVMPKGSLSCYLIRDWDYIKSEIERCTEKELKRMENKHLSEMQKLVSDMTRMSSLDL